MDIVVVIAHLPGVVIQGWATWGVASAWRQNTTKVLILKISDLVNLKQTKFIITSDSTAALI